MDDIYSVIEQQQQQQQQQQGAKGGFVPEGEFDKEAWAAKKKAEREAAYTLVDEATEKATASPAGFKDYLDVLARFNNYSTANSLLIYEQRPEAIHVGDFDYWKRHGERVKGGETGIMILEPGQTYEREDGSDGVSYNVKRVFDASQTTARAHAPRQRDAQQVLTALVTSPPVAITATDAAIGGDVARYDHEAKTVTVARGFEAPELFRALATELAHASLAGSEPGYTREANDEAARAAAYTLARRFGVDAAALEPQDTPGLGGGTAQELRVALGRIRGAVKEIAERTDRNLGLGKEPRAQEKGGRDER